MDSVKIYCDNVSLSSLNLLSYLTVSLVVFFFFSYHPLFLFLFTNNCADDYCSSRLYSLSRTMMTHSLSLLPFLFPSFLFNVSSSLSMLKGEQKSVRALSKLIRHFNQQDKNAIFDNLPQTCSSKDSRSRYGNQQYITKNTN